jgi:quinohemoprotein ethanol dehydrogenase
MLGSLSAQHGWSGRDHPRRLLTFALGGSASLPASPAPAPATVLTDDAAEADLQQVVRGQTLFNNCLMCHGLSAVAGGYAPDLRAAPAVLSAASFEAIVRGGALEARGMPRFAELNPEALSDLRAFIRSRARAAGVPPPGP